MDKAEIRQQLRKEMLAMTESDRADQSKKICQNLISTEEFQNASTIMIYLSLPQEVDTSEAILFAWQQGKTVAVPKISWQQRRMMPVIINTLETGFSTTATGLRNPLCGAPVPIEQIDLVISPAIGFDKKGNRLGRGAGYYDRFLAPKEVRLKRCGLAFSIQIVDELPITENDQPMDFLITDSGIIYFNK